MKTLTIKLTAVLQSWGNEALYNYRTSTHLPTKSAIIGMLAAALGYERNDPRIKALDTLRFAVRVDQPGHSMTDFHMVHYYKNAEKKTGASAKVTYRQYYADAIYLVALTGQDNDMEKLEYALHHPVFPLYFGRRANVPSGVLKTKLYDTDNPIDMLKKAVWEASTRFQKQHEKYHAEIISDAPVDATDTRLVKDSYIAGKTNRQFGYRPVVKTSVMLKKPNVEEPSFFDVV